MGESGPAHAHTHHCRSKLEITSSGLSVSFEQTWARKINGSSAEAVDGEPMEVIRVGTRGVITDFTERTRTVTRLGAAMEVVLAGAALAERDYRT